MFLLGMPRSRGQKPMSNGQRTVATDGLISISTLQDVRPIRYGQIAVRLLKETLHARSADASILHFRPMTSRAA